MFFLAFLQIFSLFAHEEGRRMMLIKIKRVHRELQINEEGIFFEKKKIKNRELEISVERIRK